jgi:hypothetical protein
MVDLENLRSEITKRRKISVKSEFGDIPGSIRYLDDFLNEILATDDKHLIFALIFSECLRANNKQLEIFYLEKQIELLPAQPIFIANLATALMNFDSKKTEALEECVKAVRLARQQNQQVKYCLSCQARIALELKNYEVFNRTLQDLIDDAGNHRNEDTNFEFDFLEHEDISHCDTALVKKYAGFAKN